jgi:hypothetical protein
MKGEELGGDLEIVQYHRPKGEAGSGESIKRFGENWEIAGNRDNGEPAFTATWSGSFVPW